MKPPSPVDIVGRTCEKYLPSVAQRSAARRPCTLVPARRHGVQASYGKTSLDTLLHLLEVCKPECTWHLASLDLQIDPWQRFLCFQELLEIKELPDCYDANTFRAFCRQQCENYVAEELGDRPAIPPAPATPRAARASGSRARPATPRTPARSRARSPNPRTPVSTPYKSLGRKRAPRQLVTFYVYTADHTPPLSFQVPGFLESNNRIRIPFYDNEVRSAIAKGFDLQKGQRLGLRFLMWDVFEVQWGATPKKAETIVLREGEGRIFKNKNVQHVADWYPTIWAALPFDAYLSPSSSARALSPPADDFPPPTSSSPVMSPTKVRLQNASLGVAPGDNKGKGKAREMIDMDDDDDASQ